MSIMNAVGLVGADSPPKVVQVGGVDAAGDLRPMVVGTDGSMISNGAGAVVTPTVTVSTTPAYAAGDSVGGKLTLTSAVRVSGGIALLQSVVILDRANQKPAGTLLIFDSDPSAATITDNAAFVYSTDDLKVVAAIPVATTDYITINSKAIANIRNIGALVKAASGTTLYAAFVLTSTPTFAATTNVQIELGLIHVN